MAVALQRQWQLRRWPSTKANRTTTLILSHWLQKFRSNLTTRYRHTLKGGPGTDRKIVRTVVVGNFWGRNFGDDLMLLGLFTQIPSDELVVLCQNDAERLRETGVLAEPLSIRRYLRAARSANHVVIPGGTHLQFEAEKQPGAQYRLLTSWLALAIAARMRNARMEMKSIGVGPLESTFSRLLARWTCRLCASITLRDATSQHLLADWGIHSARVDDLAFPFLRRWRTEHPLTEDSGNDSYIVAAPAFARYDTQWWVDRLAEESAALRVRRVAFFASGRQSGGDDLEAISAITRRLNTIDIELDQTYVYQGDTVAALGFIDGAAAVVAARYHVVLAARALGKRVVADAYHPKVLDAMKVEPLDEL